MKRAIILRGLPGSGKSTLANEIAKLRDDCVIFNADAYHYVGQEYRYNPDRAGWAHSQCLRSFIEDAMAGQATLIVDNTNTSAMQMLPYIRVAEAFGYSVWIVEIKSSILQSIKYNIHRVPEEAICRMAMGLSKGLPPGYQAQYVCRYVEYKDIKDEVFIRSLAGKV